jgi:hypothetical protein
MDGPAAVEGSTMPTKSGSMATDRPARYAKQLFGHWSERGPVTEEDGATVQHWKDGRTITLRPEDGELAIELSVPADGDVDAFAEVVARHLERFGTREELSVVWE